MNNDHRIALKDDPPSPTDETTACSSTVHSMATSAALSTLQDQRHRLQRETVPLVVASGASAVALVVTVVPLHILIGAVLVMSLWMTLFLNLARRAQVEFQGLLMGRGVGDYIPESWYEQLVNTSFHDFMVNGTFMQEYQHYALYFIPGLTTEQLENYVNRLVPRHRRELQRPGLGNVLGPQFMRLIMGDERLPETQNNRQGTVPRRLEYDHTENEDEDESLNFEYPSEQFVRFMGLEPSSGDDEEATPLRDPRLSRAIEVEHDETSVVSDEKKNEEEEENLDTDADVLMDAAQAGFVGVTNFAFGLMTRSVTRNVSVFSRNFFRVTLSVGVVSVGLGALGVWSGFLNPQDLPRFELPRNWSRPSMAPSSAIFLSSTIASGATASLFMMFGWRNNDDSKPRGA